MPKPIEEYKGPIGRPPRTIDWDLVDNLLMAGSNGVQVAAVLDMHNETLYDRCVSEKGMSFTEYSYQKRSKGDSMIHSTQFEVALKKKDRGMLIWLGKNRLGQRDTPKEEAIAVDLVAQFGAYMKALEEAQKKISAEKEIQDAFKTEEINDNKNL